MKKEWTMEETQTMPVIALRGLTVFPNVLIHFDVSREISIWAVPRAYSKWALVTFIWISMGTVLISISGYMT